MFRIIAYVIGGLIALTAAFFGGRYSAQRSAEAPKPAPKPEEKKAEAPAPSPVSSLRQELAKLDDEKLKQLLQLLAAQELAGISKGLTAAAGMPAPPAPKAL